MEGKEYGIDDYVDFILKLDAHMLGLSFVTFQAPAAYQTINILKKASPSLTVICGGPHPTAAPWDVLQKSDADLCVVGEGENTFTELLHTFEEAGELSNRWLQKISGLAMRDGTSIVNTSARPFIMDLDSIPFPAWDLVDFSKYAGYHWKKASRDVAMVSSRGCPYDCVFCSNPVWKSNKPWLRMRSPRNVADEIEMLYETYEVREIFDFSDEFNSSVDWATRVCNEIKSLGLRDFFFKCQLRADKITDELADGLSDIGCWLAQVGIESGNQQTLDGIRKGITLEQVLKGCRRLKKRGIKVLGFFMVFNVWEKNGELHYEDRRMSENTFKFARKLISERLIDYMSWSITTPMPGSSLFDLCTRHHLLREKSYCYSGLDHITLNLPNVGVRDIELLKAKGTILQVYSSLLGGNLNWRSLPYALRKIKLVFQHFF